MRGGVTSPTFVIARVHPSLDDGPDLVHVDAYRLGGIEELDDLDLDTSLDAAVTVVEWGAGLAEALAERRLEVTITRALADEVGTDDLDPRRVELRWVLWRPGSLAPCSSPSTPPPRSSPSPCTTASAWWPSAPPPCR